MTSPGGIAAWLVEDYAVPMFALCFAFEGGSSQDPIGKEGLANLVAYMLSRGGGDETGTEFRERVEDLGIRVQFGAPRDMLYCSLEMLSESRDAAIRAVQQLLKNPRFSAEAVETARRRALARSALLATTPLYAARLAWDAVAFAGHPYARPIMGTESSLSAIAVDDVEGYCKRIIARDKLNVVAVGDITADELTELLDTLFGELPASAMLVPIAKADAWSGARRTVVDMDVAQSVALFGLPGIPIDDPDYRAAQVVSLIAGGGGLTSKLMEELRSKRGLAYSVSTNMDASRYASTFKGNVATRNDRLGTALDVICEELRKMSEGGFDDRDLDDAKSYVIGSQSVSLDSNTKIAAALLNVRIGGSGPDYLESRKAEIAALTLADLRRVARRMLNVDDLIVSIAGRGRW